MHLLNPKGEDARLVWGHQFTWTTGHSTPSEIRHLLYTYDKLATDALDRLDLISPPTSKGWKCPHGAGEGHRDLYLLLQEHAASDDILAELWKEVSTVPGWVDWDQIKRGQQVVYQFSGQILLGLMYKSLLGGMGAWRVVETLSRTGGFGVNVTRRRLLETLQHFMDVIEDLDSIKPGGKGYESSVRVRLLHAAVRRRLMQLEEEKPGYFDTAKWGVPINDLHQIGTISVYSVAIVFMALPRQGIYLSEQQTADYLALWRWVGYLLGTPVDWMATTAQAKAMMESVMTSEIEPSDNSRILANNLLTSEARVPPLYSPREYLAAQAYRLNGHDLASALGIAKPALYYRALVWMQCFILILFSYSYPLLTESMQRSRDQNFRNIAYHMITSHKAGGIGEPTKFNFQYLPRIGMMTKLGPLPTAPSKEENATRVTKAVVHDPSRAVLVVGLLFGSVLVMSFFGLGLRAVPQNLMTIISKSQALQGLG